MDIIDYRNASTLERLLEAHRSLGQVLQEYQAPIVEKKDDSPKGNTCIFERIIVFTNNTNPKENKSLRLINEATKDFDVEVHAFNVDEVDARREENKIIVWDGDNELVLEEASNIRHPRHQPSRGPRGSWMRSMPSRSSKTVVSSSSTLCTTPVSPVTNTRRPSS